MKYRPYGDRSTNVTRRREQVRHLLRSIGVEVADNDIVPFFVETEPGKFRRNQRLKGVEVKSDQLRTLRITSDVPAKIPPDGLPTNVLERLIQIGTSGADDL
jgi:hypothetical protein